MISGEVYPKYVNIPYQYMDAMGHEEGCCVFCILIASTWKHLSISKFDVNSERKSHIAYSPKAR